MHVPVDVYNSDLNILIFGPPHVNYLFIVCVWWVWMRILGVEASNHLIELIDFLNQCGQYFIMDVVSLFGYYSLRAHYEFLILYVHIRNVQGIKGVPLIENNDYHARLERYRRKMNGARGE